MSCKVILKVVMVIINSAIFNIQHQSQAFQGVLCAYRWGRHMLLTGVGTVFIGVFVEIKRKQEVGKTEDKHIFPELVYLANAGYSLIPIGSVLTFIGFLGCCGAMCENKCMLMTFFISILIMVIVEVVAVAILLSNPQLLNVYFIAVVIADWDTSALIAGVAFSIIAIEIAAMIVSMVLYKHLPGNLQVFSAAC